MLPQSDTLEILELQFQLPELTVVGILSDLVPFRTVRTMPVVKILTSGVGNKLPDSVAGLALIVLANYGMLWSRVTRLWNDGGVPSPAHNHLQFKMRSAGRLAGPKSQVSRL